MMIHPVTRYKLDDLFEVTHLELEENDAAEGGYTILLALEDLDTQQMAELAYAYMDQGHQMTITDGQETLTFSVDQFFIPYFGSDVWIHALNLTESPS